MSDYIKKIQLKIKKIGVKKVILIVILFILMIVLIAFMLKYIQKKIYITNVSEKEYNSLDDFKTVEEAVTYMGGSYLGEKDLDDKFYATEVQLRFNKDLYDGKLSNEGFFDDLATYIAHVLHYSNFTMRDKERDIYIEVICDSRQKTVVSMHVNGNPNYFQEQDSKNQLDDFKKSKDTSMKVNSKLIYDLIQNNWIISKVNIGKKYSSYDKYDIYFDQGISVRDIGGKVFNVVFDKKYVNPVVNGIKVGDSFESIKEIFGKPTFETNEIIGYKNINFYVFFENDEISVYKNDNEVSPEFTKILNSNYSPVEFKKIANKITDIWGDYNEFDITNGYVSLEYALKGVKFEYNISDRDGITLYSNYKGEVLPGKTLDKISKDELPEYINIDVENDLVFESEMIRRAKISNEKYMSAMNKNSKDGEKKKLTNNLVDYYSVIEKENKFFRFKSPNNEFAKSEICVNSNSYIWIGDYEFVYSVEGEGIYLYNVLDRTTKKLVEGNEEYKINDYKDGILYCGDKQIKIK